MNVCCPKTSFVVSFLSFVFLYLLSCIMLAAKEWNAKSVSELAVRRDEAQN
jgi:hypothetical protein